MDDSGFVEDELILDWDHLLDNLPDDLNFDFCDQPAAADGFSNSPDSLSIDDIEQYLMNDASNFPGEKDENNFVVDGFFSDVLLDWSPESASGSDRSKDSSTSPESGTAETEDAEEKEKSMPHDDGADVQQMKENNVVDIVDDDDDDKDDPVAKKRKRQMRNRDAAVRSRERKKMYVKDLEMKSKYYEAECKRLGILLQCYVAENQALKLSLHNSKAFDASMSKQESAVLLLESLLLGSLLGFLGIMCLLIVPTHLLSTLETVLLLEENAEWGRVAPRKTRSKVYHRLIFQLSTMGKRCKASRTRMKNLRLSAPEQLVL